MLNETNEKKRLKLHAAERKLLERHVIQVLEKRDRPHDRWAVAILHRILHATK